MKYIADIIFITIALAPLFVLLISSVRDFIKSKKKWKKFDEYSSLNDDIIKWSEEITDQNVRQEFLSYGLSLILPSLDEIYQKDFEKERDIIKKRWVHTFHL
jgi:hypothetical protein